MKTQTNIGVYDTYSTELSAALRAIGCDLLDADPIRRIFDENHPANPSVSHGLKRGGRVQYRHKVESDQFDTKTADLAQVFTAPFKEFDHASGQWKTIPEDRFDSMLAALREKLKGTEAGGDLEAIIREFPREIMRYLAASFKARKENIKEIAENSKIVELVLVRKEDGHFVLHHIDLDPAKIQDLIEA